MAKDKPTLSAFLTLFWIVGVVHGNYSSERCPIHCAAQRSHPCPGEDGTPAGVPIPEQFGGLDNDGNCRPEDHGKFLYKFVTNESGGKQCVKCYCFQDSALFELIDPSCYKVNNEVCTGFLEISDPTEVKKVLAKIRHQEHSQNRGRGSLQSSAAASRPQRPLRMNQALKNCKYFGMDCTKFFWE